MTVNQKKVPGHVSLLMATSRDMIINYWVVTKVNTLTTCSFLDETIKYCRKELGKCRLVVFMDNARMHLSDMMKKLAKNQRVYFLLNSPLSSKMNQIEYVFEVIKRSFRKRWQKTKGQSLAADVFERVKQVETLHLSVPTMRARRENLRAILSIDMWKRFN
jgi:transposase